MSRWDENDVDVTTINGISYVYQGSDVEKMLIKEHESGYSEGYAAANASIKPLMKNIQNLVEQQKFAEGVEQGKKEAYEEILERIDEGLCEFCEHQDEKCYKHCAEYSFEKETFLKWMKERTNEQ